MFKYKESETLELKSKFNDDVITKEIVAFLNNRGGVIYVGITDYGEIVGVEKIDESLRRLSDIVSTKIEPLPTELIKSNIIMEEVLENRENRDGGLNVGLNVGLNKTEQNIIGELLINPYLSQKELAEKIKCSERTINRSFV